MLKNLLPITLLLTGFASMPATDDPVLPVAESVVQPDVADHLAQTLTDRQAELVGWAEQRFAEAGLSLPEMEIGFSPTCEPCRHAAGRYQRLETRHRVTICTIDSDSFGAELQARRTLLHEFAHAWDQAHLTDGDRGTLLATFGLGAWNDANDPWELRGIEYFAEIMVFGLLDQPRRQLEVDVECEAAAAAFELIVGQPPLGPSNPWCVAQAT